ncbi:M23 family metallopeptidase [Desulfarculus baarsii]|uniref:M23 family metallopeptidase n=1 Tax=Desulfarculus baarsii TaxID=453230 RepID=UPI0002E9A8B0|nr:M23 family metallopeptidase [Desulfarculus baarsii]
MNRLALSLMLAFFVLCPGPAAAQMIHIWPTPLGKGQPAMVTACLRGSPARAEVEFLGRKTPLQRGARGCYYAVVAAPLDAPLGRQTLRVFADGRQAAAALITVKAMDYGVRRITVHKKFDDLSPAELEKYKKDQAKIAAAYSRRTPERYWSGPFIRPVPGVVVSKFGRRSVVNGVEKLPHSGVDLRAATGEPVKATAAGVVAVALDHYFGGQTIIIDHGQGVVSRYLHLSAMLVKEGQRVAKGQIIAEVGATGRVTGPHLDFGVGVGGARIDPLAWLELSRRYAAALEAN